MTCTVYRTPTGSRETPVESPSSVGINSTCVIPYFSGTRTSFSLLSYQTSLKGAHAEPASRVVSLAGDNKCGSKCTRPQNNNNPPPKHAGNDKLCSNAHCGAQRGHEFNECIAYGGDSQGKYTEWWQGPWSIHLPWRNITGLTTYHPKATLRSLDSKPLLPRSWPSHTHT